MKKFNVNKFRNYWTISASRIGLSNRYGNFKSEAEARDAADELWAKHKLGIIEPKKIVTKSLTVKDAADSFLNLQDLRVKNGQIGIGHRKDMKVQYEFLISKKHWIFGSAFKDSKLEIVGALENKEEVGQFLLGAVLNEVNPETQKPYSKSTQEKRLKFIKSVFFHAIAKGLCAVNPLTQVTLGKSNELSDRTLRIQPKSIAAFLHFGLEGEEQQDQVMAKLAVETGLRQGELRALTWDCVDLAKRRIHIKSAVKSGDKSTIGKPKTASGVRSIPISEKLGILLSELRLRKHNFLSENDIVFSTSTGNPKQKKTIHALVERMNKRCAKAVAENLLEAEVYSNKIIWQDFRHFFASLQLTKLGAQWHIVCEYMGHTNPSFTKKQYGHWIEDEQKDDMVREAAQLPDFEFKKAV